ncbi:WD40-repeat-containing domain protein [Exophiala viscosa]|uniref:WD40-repeat-containing domain protein n=1 Tax=Exophiala viscosa TaxID=2486360 RepID=A0AAN6DR47_9EURO|nr:WD40-repeat-containing domain protein [Exophiala viscosa]
MVAPTKLKPNAGLNNPTDALEKDAIELRLEKALFGDDAGFFNSLKRSQTGEDETGALIRHEIPEGEDEDGVEDPDHLSDVADDDLFFLDAGTGKLPSAVSKDLEKTEPQHISALGQPTWYDSDDDRITVSLASHTRLRKLRDTEDDDVVSGREYIERLRRQYERLHPTPEWVTYARKRRRLSTERDEKDADSDSDVSMDDGDSLVAAQPLAELLRSAGSLTRTDTKGSKRTGPRKLRPEVIDIQRTKDIAKAGPSSIDTMQFHPYYPLLLSAGPSSTVTIHHISPQPPNPNPILTSLHLKGTPLHTAAFCKPSGETANDNNHDQTRIFLSSRRRYFHTWSLSTGVVTKVTRALYGQARKDQRTMEDFKISPCGRYMGLIGSGRKGGGTINVLSTESMQWICSCRIDSQGGVADFAWWRDGNGFAAVGKNGEVSEYDIDSRSVVARWIDEGAVGTTVIALGGDIGQGSRGGDWWVAIGSSSGVVNIYDRRGWTATAKAGADANLDEKPKPARVLDQLVTPISHVEFSQDGQMMVMASRWKQGALRLVHLPSCTVYRNWPTEKTPLGRISAVALSPDGSYLAIGNDQGKIKLWEISE